MRVEVDNIVDEALMVSAMVEAVRAFKNAMGDKFVGLSKAVISFKGVDADGRFIDLCGADGGDYVIKIDNKNCEDLDSLERKKVEDSYFAERRDRIEYYNEVYYMLNHVTKILCNEIGEEFFNCMNEIIEDVWREYRPVQLRGKERGKLKPVPLFGVERDGFRYIYSDKDIRNGRRPMKNPFFGAPNYAGFPVRWKSKEWDEVSRRILKVMKQYAQEMVPDGKVKERFLRFELRDCPVY